MLGVRSEESSVRPLRVEYEQVKRSRLGISECNTYDALNGHLLSASVVTSAGTSLRQLVRSFFTSVRFLQRWSARFLQACASYIVGAFIRPEYLRLYRAFIPPEYLHFLETTYTVSTFELTWGFYNVASKYSTCSTSLTCLTQYTVLLKYGVNNAHLMSSHLRRLRLTIIVLLFYTPYMQFFCAELAGKIYRLIM